MWHAYVKACRKKGVILEADLKIRNLMDWTELIWVRWWVGVCCEDAEFRKMQEILE
jgi:hypothetical protein